MAAQSPLRVKAHTVAKELMTRQERLEFAEQILCLPHCPRSWGELTDDQIYRLADAMHGFLLIAELRRQHR